jgi:hypothetical protein
MPKGQRSIANLSEWGDLITLLFQKQGLSILMTRARLIEKGCPPFQPRRLRDYLRSIGLYEMRGRGRTIPKEGICSVCNRPFLKRNHSSLYCEICVPDKTARRRMHSWGISQEQFEKLLESQKWLCACCSRDLSSENSRSIHIDHCHKTGDVRSIICANCNYLLGLLESAWWQERFKQAREYLDKHGRE